MTRTPAKIFRNLNGPAVAEEYILKVFALDGYGGRSCRKWIREFIELGWISDNFDGTYRIDVPYRH